MQGCIVIALLQKDSDVNELNITVGIFAVVYVYGKFTCSCMVKCSRFLEAEIRDDSLPV